MTENLRAAAPPSERVAVVMLTWNALDYTKRALSSLRAATSYRQLDIVVVDNGSDDGTVEWLRTLPGIKVIANGRNLGFTGGVNVGLAALDGDEDVILLNNDLVVTQADWVDRLRDCAYSSPDIGIVGCRLVDSEGRLQHGGSYVTPGALHGEQIGGELDVGQYRARREVECAVGAALYVKRAVLDITGGLHREYFSYFEDTDLCYEAARSGFRTMYAGDVTLLHHQNVSTRANRVDMWEMFERSHDIFVRRWGDGIRSRYSPTVELRAPYDEIGSAAADDAAELALALHGAFVGVVPRLLDGGVPQFRHPLLADLASADGPLAAPRLVVGRAVAPPPGPASVYLPGSTRAAADLSGFDAVWAASESAAAQWKEAGVGAPVEVAAFGVDPAYFHPGARRFRTRPVLVVGVVVALDGTTPFPLELVRSFNRRFRRHDRVVLHCHVRGEGEGPDVGSVIGSAGIGNDGGRVVVTTATPLARPERCALYASWDACVVAGGALASCVPVLEPLAVGLPTVGVGTGATAEVLDGECGWLVDGDPDSAAAAIAEIVENPDEARRRGAEGARRAGAHTWARTAERIRGLLETM